jgi:membrane associated rhomboid family serine protease
MLDNPSDIVVGITGVAFAFMGLAAIIAPSRVTAQFDIPALTIAGRNEVRAVYGGFGLAVSGMLALAIFDPTLRPGICLTIGMALAGMAGGRLLSAGLDRALPRWPLVYCAIEAVGAVLLIYGT